MDFAKFEVQQVPRIAHFRLNWRPRRALVQGFVCMQLSKSCFPLQRGAHFQKNDQQLREEGAMSDKKTKKTVDSTRNSQKWICDAYSYFRRSALEAKNAPHCSQKQYFEGGMERKIANRTGKGATRANKSGKNGSYEGRLGVRQVTFLMQSARSRFAKSCSSLQREALF